ncbi:hypothetical protein MPSEU_000560600 [Mayamaea pseudoterrestris]|nr:hypothetical protein MPSEU_000560600 [Mayamaea pseudoterrestris]
MQIDEVEKQKKANAKLEMQLQEVKLKIVRLEQANKESEEVEVQLDDLLEQMDKFKEMVNELELTLKQIKTNEKETSAIQYETDKAKHQHKLLQEKIISQRKHHKLQIDGAQEALDTLKASLLVVEKGRRDAMARRQESEAELRNIEASMNEQQAKTEEEITSMLAEFKEVERAFLERQDKRLALIGISNL